MMKKILFWTAVFGWTASLLVHLLAIAHIDARHYVPPAMLLHIGIFVVWVPAILELRRNKTFQQFEGSGFGNRLNPVKSFNAMMTGTPAPMRLLAIAGFFYAIANFLFFMTAHNASPDIMDGRYVLHNHGKIVRYISKGEYESGELWELRAFSGHWIAFYGMAAAILFPFKKESDALPVAGMASDL
jgi:hypothetical protein